MIINHNMNAMNATRKMSINANESAKSMEKLSSGLRINKAGDDAAGLSISEKMRAQIKGLDQASRNSQDGVSMLQTAEGALNETHSILQRMRELAVQASNDTNVTKDREAVADEMDSLQKEITRISTQTEFNTQALFSAASTTVSLQVGANCGQQISVTFCAMDSTTLGVNAMSSNVSSSALATAAISTINTAIESVSKERSKLGAVANRLEHTIANVENASENLQSSESRVRDVNMAKEMVLFSKNSILQQAAQAMTTQAMTPPKQVGQMLQQL